MDATESAYRRGYQQGAWAAIAFVESEGLGAAVAWLNGPVKDFRERRTDSPYRKAGEPVRNETLDESMSGN